MSKVLADNYPRSINQYVPLMEFAADVVDGKHFVSLGAPSTLDSDGILNNASATNSATSYSSSDWETTFDGSSTHIGETVAGSLNAKYGRCLTLVGTAGSNHVVTITGRDYLGQIMSEALTLSGTVIIYGQKAFKYVDTIAAAAGAASDTFDAGWTDVLGLPYRSTQLLGWTEDNINKEVGTYVIPVDIVDAVSADTVFGIGAEAGFVTGMDCVTTVALGSGDAVLTVEIGGVAVAGLSVTVASSGSAIGVIDSDNAITWNQGDTSDLAAHGVIEVVSDGGSASNGTIDCRINMDKNVLFVDGDATTATTTTGDTRGLVRPHTACDASIVYECQYAVLTNNLHGLVQA
jgi:hypothetical protein